MFSIIAQRQFGSLFRLGEQFLGCHNINAALLCFDYGFSTGIRTFSGLDLSEIIPILSNLFEYVRILCNIIFNIVGPENVDIYKVFGVKENADDATFVVTSGTFVYQHRHKVLLESSQDQKDDINQIAVSRDLLIEIIRRGLDERLRKLVVEENLACQQAAAFSICMRFITFNGDCNESPCSRPHVVPDHDWFQSWIRAHLLQILVYHSIVPLLPPQIAQPQQRYVQLTVPVYHHRLCCIGFGSKDYLTLSIPSIIL